MDLTPYIGWIVFLHVAAAFLFAAGHGVSMFVAFQLRRETDRGRMLALLDVSAVSLITATIAVLVLLVAGIVAGIVLQSYGRAWIWVSLVLLVVIGGLMTPLGVGHFARVRQALGQKTRGMKPEDPDPVPASDDALTALLTSRAPETLLAIGGGGFFLILWLMMFKPF
jgi:hypothetical protein